MLCLTRSVPEKGSTQDVECKVVVVGIRLVHVIALVGEVLAHFLVHRCFQLGPAAAARHSSVAFVI